MKNIENLSAGLEAIFVDGMNFEVFLGVEENGELIYLRGDLDQKSTDGICESYVESVRKFFKNDALCTLPLSEIDARSDVLLGYDLPDKPVDFKPLEDLLVAQNVGDFSFKNHEISDVKTIAIRISSAVSKVIFFKQMYPVSYVKQNQIMLLKAGDRLTYLPSDVLKISGGFDLILFDDYFYINEFKKFEKSFKFYVVAKQIQRKTSNVIIALNIVDDVKSYLLNGLAPQKDFLRVAKSEVLALPPATILQFAVLNQSILGFNIVNSRIQLTSKDSVKKLIKLLNDDYLKSTLTQNDYDSLAKNKMA
ncbi:MULTISPECIES: anti-phage protein KwaB [unclassified Janthinobacterium]|uniref:anti-phage protein KwaB n=1 Tax=unclassified Janthinobacterium TaxID=2610881 RepID=UPI00161FB0D5|nr:MULTISPECIES: anti-phage protein KwaB [unclassified Janthinobacterium]MBB5369325.1 hypothetical protein [Janthinobacterium sp. K2C7]MBB5381139.1 hypothetical protein [Janthinobacterium sp. K2Li3]MBB5387708.1 hypothetical protein [Janthinobacterium sp. K2E3]